MQNDLFRQVVEAVVNDIEEASKAAQDAKAQGLDYIGFGRYGKNGKVTHTSKGGKLTPVAKRQQSTPQNRFNTAYKPNDQKNEPAWVRGTGGKYYSSIDGAQWDGPGAGRGATPYSSAPYDPYAG